MAVSQPERVAVRSESLRNLKKIKIKSSAQTEKLPSGALPHGQKAAVTTETTCDVSEHVVFHQSSGHVTTGNNGAWVKESLKFQSATVSSPELMGEWTIVAVACPGAPSSGITIASVLTTSCHENHERTEQLDL